MDGVSGGERAAVWGMVEAEVALDDKVYPIGIGTVDEYGRVFFWERGAAFATYTNVGKTRLGPVDIEGAICKFPIKDLVAIA